MALLLGDCTFVGPALPEPFVKFRLEEELTKRKLLPRAVGLEQRALQERWDVYRRKLRALGEQGGDRRVASHVLEPLAERLGYDRFELQPDVVTREGAESGGWLFTGPDGRVLRAWSVGLGVDLDAPSRRGRAYRFSPSRIAQRVLLARGERVGLLTDGEELRLLVCDPARPDSHIGVRLDRSGGWRTAESAPDSYRLLRALASPDGVAAIASLTDAARLAQSAVTKKLRVQARRAIEGLLQEVLDHPSNTSVREQWPDAAALAKALWSEGLILVYRLLFVLKLESSADPARAFSFASTSLWRNTYSPNTALAGVVRKVIDHGAESGGFLEGGLRALWRLFAHGLSSSELEVKPLGGMLFGPDATPLLDRMRWGERGVARLLDALFWTPGDGRTERERVHYGALDVEDLGRVYEALLELEPGITDAPMCRLRRAKLEVVVPLDQGAPYRLPAADSEALLASDADDDSASDDDDTAEEDDAEDDAPKRRGKDSAKTKVQFIEAIPAGRFFLRVGLGRKASGSYYTPHPFVRFLVQETLAPQLAERSPKDDPQPSRILALKALDPAMGSGHFLVEACRYLGEALYEACRLCDELAVQAEEQADALIDDASEPERQQLRSRALALRDRVEALPDPDDALMAYLPSRAAEGEASGLSQKKAESLCRRLVAVHCLYGVDKNRLAVELAKLSLWLESYAEGMPLTFMDHRLICGDSLTGPFPSHNLTLPKSGLALDDLFAQGLTTRLETTLATAMGHVRELEATVGKDVADLELKREAKQRLDVGLAPLKRLAAAWSGGVMLGERCDDVGYQALAAAVAEGRETADVLDSRPALRRMVDLGADSVAFHFAVPEVFQDSAQGGFDAVLGNPPWDAIQFKSKEFLAAFDLAILEAPTKRERSAVEARLLASPGVSAQFVSHQEDFERLKRANDRLFEFQKVIVDGDLAGRQLDAFRVFMERNAQLTRRDGYTGVVVPSAFHANAGATGVRRLYLESMALGCCFSFENRRKLFEIDSRFKFAAIVARKDPGGTTSFECGFYWHDLERLFDGLERLRYRHEFVSLVGGAHLSFPELRGEKDAAVADRMGTSSSSTGEFLKALGIALQQTPATLHSSKESHRCMPVGNLSIDARRITGPSVGRRGDLLVHEGKTFRDFEDVWGPQPRYLLPLQNATDLPLHLERARGYQLAVRKISRSTDERTILCTLLPPGVVLFDSALVDSGVRTATSGHRLAACACLNAHPFDWIARQFVAANVNLFIVRNLPWPRIDGPKSAFLAHLALRLTCNHAGYEALWCEQLGEAWREPTPQHTWPVVAGDDARWTVRAAIDAVVADAYGLDRVQYEHVLSSFTHKSYPRAPERCLAAYDKLKSIGLDAFAQRHDPYWDIPLNESLPKPVIDLPLGSKAEPEKSGLSLFDAMGAPAPQRKARRG